MKQITQSLNLLYKDYRPADSDKFYPVCLLADIYIWTIR